MSAQGWVAKRLNLAGWVCIVVGLVAGFAAGDKWKAIEVLLPGVRGLSQATWVVNFAAVNESSGEFNFLFFFLGGGPFFAAGLVLLGLGFALTPPADEAGI